MPTHPVIDPVITTTPLDPVSIAVFIVAFAAVAYATTRRPSYGIVALIAFVPFGYSHDIGATTITLDKVALVAMALGLAITKTNARVFGTTAIRTIGWCAVAVVAATVLSLAGAYHREPVVRETLKAMQYLTTFVIVAIATRADADDRTIRITIAAIALVVSALAIAQEVFGAPSGLWFDSVPIPRIAGPLEGPNQLAAYLGMQLAVVAAYAVRKERTPFEIATLAVGTAALVLTISRAGVLSSLAGIAVVIAVSATPRRRAAVIAIATGGIAGCVVIGLWGFAAAHSLVGLALLDRFASLAQASAPGRVGTRSQLWNAAFVLWKAHPVFGIGAGNFELELARAGYPQLHTHANSLYFQALAEGGMPLFAATLALVFASISRFARGPFSEPLVAGALGASIGLAAHQVFDLLAFFPKVGEMWWIVLALGAVRVDRAA